MSKLDLKTKIFLYLTGLNVLEPSTTYIEIEDSKMTDVYVFDSYDDYYNYIKLYLNNAERELFKNAVTTTLEKGQVVVIKKICDSMIIKQRIKEFYESYDPNRINEIHRRGKITPLEKVEEYESYGACAPGEFLDSVKNRCKLFSNCHECLLEFASYQQEYDIDDSKEKTLKKYR